MLVVLWAIPYTAITHEDIARHIREYRELANPRNRSKVDDWHLVPTNITHAAAMDRLRGTGGYLYMLKAEAGSILNQGFASWE